MNLKVTGIKESFPWSGRCDALKEICLFVFKQNHTNKNKQGPIDLCLKDFSLAIKATGQHKTRKQPSSCLSNLAGIPDDKRTDKVKAGQGKLYG